MKLPRISGKKAVDALLKAGFIVHRVRGSHYILKNLQTGQRVTIPYHRKELSLKILGLILKQADISHEEFNNLL